VSNSVVTHNHIMEMSFSQSYHAPLHCDSLSTSKGSYK